MRSVAGSGRLLPFFVLLASLFTHPVFAHGGMEANEADARSKISDAGAFEWNEQRKLTWDDFRGQLDPNEPDVTAAATFCGMGFEARPGKNRKLDIRVYNTFFPEHSWVRQGEQKESILAHEQGHFDLCELYTRKLKASLDAANNAGDNSENMLADIYKLVMQDYQKRQQQYEDETHHGIIAEAQLQWQNMIARELSDTQYAMR
jgi:hypothetical protein